MLAELGMRYVCDWVNDEQPYPLKVPPGEGLRPAPTPSRQLYALPITLPLDDGKALWDRRIAIDRSAIPAYALSSLCNHGSREGGEGIDHPVPHLW